MALVPPTSHPQDAIGDVVVSGAAAARQMILASSSSAASWVASPQSVMTTANDLLYASSANTLARIANGSTGQLLTATTGAAPSYADPPVFTKTQVITSPQILNLHSSSVTVVPGVASTVYIPLWVVLASSAGTSYNLDAGNIVIGVFPDGVAFVAAPLDDVFTTGGMYGYAAQGSSGSGTFSDPSGDPLIVTITNTSNNPTTGTFAVTLTVGYRAVPAP